MRKVHMLIQDSWSEHPWESEYLLCEKNDNILAPECSINPKAVTCKKCLKIMARDALVDGLEGMLTTKTQLVAVKRENK